MREAMMICNDGNQLMEYILHTYLRYGIKVYPTARAEPIASQLFPLKQPQNSPGQCGK